MNKPTDQEPINADFRTADSAESDMPPRRRKWRLSVEVGAMIVIFLCIVTVFIDRVGKLWSHDAPEATVAPPKDAPINIGSLPTSRIAVLDVGALTVAWGMSSGSDPNAIAEKLKQTLRQLAESGVVVVEPRYALAFPPGSDVTAQVAERVGIDLKALSAAPTSNYNNPTMPTVVEGTGWKNALPGGAQSREPSSSANAKAASSGSAPQLKGKTQTVQEDASLD